MMSTSSHSQANQKNDGSRLRSCGKSAAQSVAKIAVVVRPIQQLVGRRVVGAGQEGLSDRRVFDQAGVRPQQRGEVRRDREEDRRVRRIGAELSVVILDDLLEQGGRQPRHESCGRARLLGVRIRDLFEVRRDVLGDRPVLGLEQTVDGDAGAVPAQEGRDAVVVLGNHRLRMFLTPSRQDGHTVTRQEAV